MSNCLNLLEVETETSKLLILGVNIMGYKMYWLTAALTVRLAERDRSIFFQSQMALTRRSGRYLGFDKESESGRSATCV
jgi:hypothetical protein